MGRPLSGLELNFSSGGVTPPPSSNSLGRAGRKLLWGGGGWHGSPFAQPPVLTQNKGPGTEAHFWNPPLLLRRAPMPSPPPPAKQFSGRPGPSRASQRPPTRHELRATHGSVFVGHHAIQTGGRAMCAQLGSGLATVCCLWSWTCTACCARRARAFVGLQVDPAQPYGTGGP